MSEPIFEKHQPREDNAPWRARPDVRARIRVWQEMQITREERMAMVAAAEEQAKKDDRLRALANYQRNSRRR